MREILFRGKRKKDGKWIYGYLVKHDEFVIVDKSLGSIGCGAQVIPETIGEFTGLVDKDGTKIFEDDIVRTIYGRLCVVHWCSFPSYVGWDLTPVPTKNNLEKKPPRLADLMKARHLRVVGNVADNPELFKEETK